MKSTALRATYCLNIQVLSSYMEHAICTGALSVTDSQKKAAQK